MNNNNNNIIIEYRSRSVTTNNINNNDTDTTTTMANNNKWVIKCQWSPNTGSSNGIGQAELNVDIGLLTSPYHHINNKWWINCNKQGNGEWGQQWPGQHQESMSNTNIITGRRVTESRGADVIVIIEYHQQYWSTTISISVNNTGQ